MADFTKLNVFFYINQSFMPALDSRLGDLAQCYGRYDETNKWYDLSLIVNSNEGRYGWMISCIDNEIKVIYQICLLKLMLNSYWGIQTISSIELEK